MATQETGPRRQYKRGNLGEYMWRREQGKLLYSIDVTFLDVYTLNVCFTPSYVWLNVIYEASHSVSALNFRRTREQKYNELIPYLLGEKPGMTKKQALDIIIDDFGIRKEVDERIKDYIHRYAGE